MTDGTDARFNAGSGAVPRIETLDILRGVAVMGILAMNIVGFAMPFQAYFNPLAYGGSPGDVPTWLVNFVLVDGKMRGFFALLFGASVLLVIDRAEQSGQSALEIHYRRMIWLFLIGMAHMLFIWWGDILAHYALVGMIAWLFRRETPTMLIGWALALLAASVAMAGLNAMGMAAMAQAALAPDASADAIRAWVNASFGFAPLAPADLAADLARYGGGYGGIFQHRLSQVAGAPLYQLIWSGPETLAMMLLGMAALRGGFLTGAWTALRYRHIALWTLGIAGPAYMLMGWLLLNRHFDVPLLYFMLFGAATPFRVAMVFGYAALVILATRQGGAVVDRIAAAGRVAFSNYLGTSIAMTTLFYGYGIGLYGQLDRAQLWLVVIAMWALMLLWSKPWLDRFRYGPMEWLWRSLARGEIQTMRI